MQAWTTRVTHEPLQGACLGLAWSSILVRILEGSITVALSLWSRFSGAESLKGRARSLLSQLLSFLSSLPPVSDLCHLPAFNNVCFLLLFYLYSFQKMRVTWRSRLWKISPMTWAREGSQSLCPTQSSQKSLMPALGALGHDPGFLAGDSA